MRLVIRLLQPLRRHVRVNLRRRQVRVAEEFLDAAEIGAGVEQVRRITVTQLVRRERGIETRGGQVFFQTPLQHVRHDGRGRPPFRQKNRRRPDGRCSRVVQ